MNRYQNGLIYKIVCNDTSVKECYIGSCCNFTRRKAAHKSCCNNEKSPKYNQKKYKFIREHGGWCNWSMIQIKSFPCDNKRKLEAEERKELEINGGSLNCNIPHRTLKEYYQNYQKYREKNKEQIVDYQKEYREINKEKIAENHKKYYQENKEKITEYHKKRYNDNKEKVKEKVNEYRKKNKQQIAEYNKEKITCECGSLVSNINLSRHKKSKKHIEFTSNLI